MKAAYQLGQTDIALTPIGLGCWQFSGGKGLAGGYWEGQSTELSRSIIKAALDGGINWFDTAEAYGRGVSERTVSDGLQAAGVTDREVMIATKWMPFFRFAGSIERTFPERRDALAPYSIDLHQIHAPASFSSIKKQADAMADLVDAGAIKAVGVSNFSAGAMRRFHKALERRGLTLASNQVRYSLLDRQIEGNGVLDAARELGITIIAYSPLAQGILTGKFHEDPARAKAIKGFRKYNSAFSDRGLARTRPLVDELRVIGGRHGASAAQVALAWIIRRHGDTVVAIPGASSVSQAESNAGAMQVDLTGEDFARLDHAAVSLAN